MRRTARVSVFWNTLIYHTVPELLLPVWQIMRQVSLDIHVLVIFKWFFRCLLVDATGSPVLPHPYSHSVLLLDAPCESTASCDEDVGEQVKLKLKNLSIDQGQRRVRSSLCCKIRFLTTGPIVIVPVIFAKFSESKNCRCIFEKHSCHEQI